MNLKIENYILKNYLKIIINLKEAFLINNSNKERMINNVKATMSIENQKLTHSDIKLLEDFADNKISMDEAMDLIKKLIIKKDKQD